LLRQAPDTIVGRQLDAGLTDAEALGLCALDALLCDLKIAIAPLQARLHLPRLLSTVLQRQLAVHHQIAAPARLGLPAAQPGCHLQGVQVRLDGPLVRLAHAVQAGSGLVQLQRDPHGLQRGGPQTNLVMTGLALPAQGQNRHLQPGLQGGSGPSGRRRGETGAIQAKVLQLALPGGLPPRQARQAALDLPGGLEALWCLGPQGHLGVPASVVAPHSTVQRRVQPGHRPRLGGGIGQPPHLHLGL